MSNVDDTRLSKSLSWLLRHGAVKEGLFISPEGYVTVKQVLQHKTFRGKYLVSDIQRVVANNQKQRFTLRENLLSHGLEIKANQGHSIRDVGDEGLTPLLEPKYRTVVHGTYFKCWPQIKEQGLSCMSRCHIHLAKGTLQDTSVTSGLRQDVEVYVFVNLKKALEDGLKFYESENGVILTRGDEKFLLPKYFLKVTRVDTGYPYCTQREDLERAFASFNARVEAMAPRAAVLRCGSAGAARAACAAPQRASVYGTILGVSRHAGGPPPKPPQQPKRDFPKSKQKDMIVAPKSIELTGDFHSQLDAILAQVRLTQEEVQGLAQLYADVEMALGTIWPGCVCLPFGSITTGLGIKTSDADCFVDIPPRHRHPHHNYVNKAKRALQQFPGVFASLLGIPRASTPIVKLLHVPARTRADLSFKSVLGVRNSRLVAALLHARPALLPHAVALKYWAKVHELVGSGRLSNYALTMLVIFFLQQPPRPVLPPVCRLQQDRSLDFLVDSWNTGFSSDPALFPPVDGALPISDLLGGFFEYYAKFDFEKLVVCPYLGRPIEKNAFKDPQTLPEEFELYKKNVATETTYPLKFMSAICIQDPFEQCHNVASGVGARVAADFPAYLRFAAAAYQQERADNCRGFLAKILLEKPKTIKARSLPEFRVNLNANNAPALAEDGWKERIREAVFCVFETMLHLTLVKLKEKAKKEKYETSVTRAIWRRKSFAKMYRRLTLPLVEQETMLTKELLRVDRTEIALQLHVGLTFRKTTPRSAIVAVRLHEGEPDCFRNFGHFFLSSVQWWLIEQLKPVGVGSPAPPPPTPPPLPSAVLVDDESSDSTEQPSDNSPASDVEPEDSEDATAIKDVLEVDDCLTTPLQALTTDG